LAEKKPEEGDKKFTQEDLDRVVADRLKRETSKYSDYDELKAKAAKLDEAEASRKSDDQKLLERVEAAERKAAEADDRVGKAEANALRLSVAADKKLSPSLAKRLSGSTREELEADADELLESVKPEEGDKGGGGGGNESRRTASRPREELKGGGAPQENNAVETDPAKLAANVPRF
jgi:hypothetical protein